VADGSKKMAKVQLRVFNAKIHFVLKRNPLRKSERVAKIYDLMKNYMFINGR
jgi:hypothetical protein